MQPSSAPKTASPDEANRDSTAVNIPAIIYQLRALEAAVDDKEAASASEESGEQELPRKHLVLRLTCAVAALLPLWAGWVVFSYFYTQSTLWPLPRVALNANDTVADIALAGSILLVVLVPLLTTLALFCAARALPEIPRKLWTFALVFLGAMLLTLTPVFAIYSTLRTNPYSQTCNTAVTAYLSAGTIQLFSSGSGKPVGEWDYGQPSRGPSGDLAFLLEPSDDSEAQSDKPIAFVYDPERRVAGLDGGHTVAFPALGGERFTLRADHGNGPVVLQSRGRAPTGRGTLKVCAAAPETGRRVLVAMAVASWIYTRDS